MKHYSIDVKVSTTRRENRHYSDDLSKMNQAATLFTIKRMPQVIVKDEEEDEIIFLSAYGVVKVDKLP